MALVEDIEQKGIYTDLLRRFVADGHSVYIVYPRERRMRKPTEAYEISGVHYLAVKTLNLRQTSIVEKGLGQMLVERQFLSAIKSNWSKVEFDLILYSTPPITLIGTVEYLKRKCPRSKAYLLLKDIFPQNAVDLGMMSKTGLKGLIYNFFRKKEKALYRISDYIGCMSPANVAYLLKENPEINIGRVGVAPNSIEIESSSVAPDQTEKDEIRKKYGIPLDIPVFIYGGNLGRPQGINYIIDCMNAVKSRRDCFFLVVGSGTGYGDLKQWYNVSRPASVMVMDVLPVEEYNLLVRACDVGMVFLDHRFSIPNYPSRLLSYLKNCLPVLCATDPCTDIGRIAEANGYGFWCESDSVDGFVSKIDRMIRADRISMGRKGYEFLKNNYSVENTYRAIMEHV